MPQRTEFAETLRARKADHRLHPSPPVRNPRAGAVLNWARYDRHGGGLQPLVPRGGRAVTPHLSRLLASCAVALAVAAPLALAASLGIMATVQIGASDWLFKT